MTVTNPQGVKGEASEVGKRQSPVFFCFFFTGSSASPFEPLLTGFGFGFGFGAGFSGSESTSIGSAASPPFGFETGFVALAFFGFSLSPSSPSSPLPAFFFFVEGPLSPCLADDAFAFFFGFFVTISRSPDASDAVAPPSESELDSDGEPSSEEDAWKSSSVTSYICVCEWKGVSPFGREGQI